MNGIAVQPAICHFYVYVARTTALQYSCFRTPEFSAQFGLDRWRWGRFADTFRRDRGRTRSRRARLAARGAALRVPLCARCHSMLRIRPALLRPIQRRTDTITQVRTLTAADGEHVYRDNVPAQQPRGMVTPLRLKVAEKSEVAALATARCKMAVPFSTQ